MLAALSVAGSRPAAAQTDAWRHQSSPVLQTGPSGAWDDVEAYAPRILNRTDGEPYVDADGRYYLFYTGTGRATVPRDETGLARSRNLVTWERVSDKRPVQALGPASAYDQGDVSAVTILEENGLFHMWYEGNGRVVNSDLVTINYATSRDAITWTKYQDNPVLRQGPGDDHGDLYAPIVINDHGLWKMWYTGHDDRGRYGLMHATALAPQGPWTKSSDTFIFYPGDLFPCEVWKEQGIYYLLYMQSDTGFRQILLATSIDGVRWIHRGSVFEPAPGRAWDSRTVRWATQMHVRGTWFTFYDASGPGGRAIGMAQSQARYGFVSGGTGKPGPPLDPGAEVSGATVRIGWLPPASGDPPLGCRVEIGRQFGAADVAVVDVDADAREAAMILPEGRYFARITAQNAAGTGPPSHDVAFTTLACGSPPDDPLITWRGPVPDATDVASTVVRCEPSTFGCQAASWIVEAGSRPGLADLAVIETTETRASLRLRPGSTAFVRVRGKNGFGIGMPSTERGITTAK